MVSEVGSRLQTAKWHPIEFPQSRSSISQSPIEEWPRWSKRFERFRQASDLASKTEEVQISTLVYSMGDKAEDLLQSFNLTDEEAKKYSTVKANYENHFVKRRNTIYERAKFNRRKQEDGETVDEFITDLYRCHRRD